MSATECPTGGLFHIERCPFCDWGTDEGVSRLRSALSMALYERDDARRNEVRANGRLQQMRAALAAPESNPPPEFANAIAAAVQQATEDFMPLSVRYGAAAAAWVEVSRFLALPTPATPDSSAQVTASAKGANDDR